MIEYPGYLVILSRIIITVFGLFIAGVGVLQAFKPARALSILTQAGSTNLINYGELLIRMIPGGALIIYAPFSRLQDIFFYLGWILVITSVVLILIPRRIHHQYALLCASLLPPSRMRFLAPASILYGCVLIYAAN